MHRVRGNRTPPGGLFLRASRVRGAQALVALLGLAVLVAASVGVGSRLPSTRVLGSLPRSRALDFTVDAPRTFIPLRADFVARVLGRSLEPVGGARSGSSAGTRSQSADSRAEPRDGSTTPAPGPVISGADASPGDLFSPGGWALELSFRVDAATASPGDWITYTMTVRNVGASEFPPSGTFELRWHTPLHTAARVPQDCRLPLIGSQPLVEALCGDGLLPFPGLGEIDRPPGVPPPPVVGSEGPLVSPHNSYSSAGQLVGIPAGEAYSRQYRVQVTPTATDGTVIVNHAHLDVVTDSAPGVTSPVVEVTVTGVSM